MAHASESKAGQRPLFGLLVTQFFGAFNDNAWKQMVVLLAIAAVPAALRSEPGQYESYAQRQTAMAQMALILPLMLISLPAGVLADRVSKRTVILAMKVLELVLMLAGTIVLFFDPLGGWGALAVLALMGAQSALFSPAKYGILPEILRHEQLSNGNGLLEMFSNLAIIGGTVVGGVLPSLASGELASTLFGWMHGQQWVCGLVLSVLSVVGLVAAFAIPPVPAARAEGALVETLTGAWRAIRADRVLWLAFLGQILFWTIASLIPAAVLPYVKATLEVTDWKSGLPLALLGIGIGVGSVLAGRLSEKKVEYGLLPLGGFGLAFSSAGFAALAPAFGGTNGLLFLMGVFSGLILVPLNALLQTRSPNDRRGAVIALTNVFVFGGMFAGSALALGLAWLRISPLGTFGGAAVALAAGTVWAVRIVPDAFVRFALILLAHTLYRVRVYGRQHVPAEGPALLVPNHVSFVDGVFLIASVERPIRFVVEAAYFHRPIFGLLLRALRTIPVSATGGPRTILKALRDAGHYLDEGEIVCIFPEGQITRTGTLLPFRRGLERIVKGRNVPIVPVHLDRAIGSIFSPTQALIIPERIPYPVAVLFGAPLPTATPLSAIRQAVHDLGLEGWTHRKAQRPPLHRSFLRRARRMALRGRRLAFADSNGRRLSWLAALAGAIALGRKLRPLWQGQEHVGILLPPCVPAALLNVAASMAGKASVNLNYTTGRGGIKSAIRQAGLKTIVTNRTFLEKLGLAPGDDQVHLTYVEDLAPTITAGLRLASYLLALFAPARWIERFVGAAGPIGMDDVVTVIFSSGSTAEPKGVMLTHFNIDSNVEAVGQVFRTLPRDRVVGVLPLFHSFGYMILWFAANRGVGTVFHPNPLEAGPIGDLIERYRATILLATPTFLQVYLKRCTPAQFGSIRLLWAGAERLPERLAQAFEDTFGIRPLEGYGTTECSPVVAANTLDYRACGFYQPGWRRGTVGQPLPGVSVRIVDPETFEPLGLDTPGMLLVKGPNVMKGYLGRPDLTRAALHDGWYSTGDVAQIDEDGFLKITGRLSRFSKIGGEMVPHGKVEDALQAAAGSEVPLFAVTAIGDDRKGERLAVLHTLDDRKIPAVLERLAASGLPNLFIPRRDHFLRVDALPMLGTGKLDLRAARRIAETALASK